LSRKTPIMVSTLPLTKARINLGQVVRRVQTNKEYFILEKDGIPIAGIMNIDEFEDYLEANDIKVKRHIQKSNADIAAGRVKPAGSLLQSAPAKRKVKSRVKV
jgi:antitoxin (DNA-binding transcriptional repressor) of toxin-antitoxin stability system